jgi:mRNA interferase MazF
MAARYVPQRGDVLWLSFSPQAGREQLGRRPALVLSPRAYNARVGLALCCPITSKRKGYPFEVPLPDEAGVEGVVLADQARSVDWRARGAERAGSMPREAVRDVIARLSTLLDPRTPD